MFPIESQPLRGRRDDVPLLAGHFLRVACQKLCIGDLALTEGDVRRLSAYDWPGNVRELQNLMERAAILARDGRPRFELPSTLPQSLRSATATDPVSAPVLTKAGRRERDRENIVAALRAAGGKVFGPGGAAEMLGLKPTTLASRMRKYGLRDTGPKDGPG